MADTEQRKMLNKAREKLELTVEALAEELGVSIHTMRSWLLPEDSKKHRRMPRTAMLLLERIMAERRKGKG